MNKNIKIVLISSSLLLTSCLGTSLKESKDETPQNGGDQASEGPWNSFDKNIFVGFEDTSNNGHIYELYFDNSAILGSALSVVNNSSITVGGRLRSLSMKNDGNIIVGGSGEVNPPIYAKDLSLVGSHSPTGASDPETNSHTICTLPNGNYIVAEDTSSTGNAVNEYDSSDNFVRSVYTTVKGSNGTITQCVGVDNETVVWVETGAWGFTNSNLARVKLVNDSWSVEQVMDSESFDPGNGTNFWNLTVHSDGNVYFTPADRDGAKFNQLLRCPLNDISTTSCSAVGNPIPGVGSGNYLSWVRGIVQIPGSNDMLVFISQEVYHYNYSSGAYTSVLDFTSVFPSIDVVRSVILAPKST